MKNYESRIKKLEGVFSNKRSIFLLIKSVFPIPKAYVTFNGQTEDLPVHENLYEFIRNKFNSTKGNIHCELHFPKGTSSATIPDFSDLLEKDDLLLFVREMRDENLDEKYRKQFKIN